MPDNLSSDSIDRRDFIGAAIGVSAALTAHFGPANAQTLHHGRTGSNSICTARPVPCPGRFTIEDCGQTLDED